MKIRSFWYPSRSILIKLTELTQGTVHGVTTI
jgi:hypothetical protein